MCADLDSDRDQAGEVYGINHALNQVPLITEASLTREETGHTRFRLEIGNLVPGSVYPAYIHQYGGFFLWQLRHCFGQLLYILFLFFFRYIYR